MTTLLWPLKALNGLLAAERRHRLDSDRRATLIAFYIRGRSLKQMSREFETPIGTIKRRLHVARHRLKTVLEKMGVGDPTEQTDEVELSEV